MSEVSNLEPMERIIHQAFHDIADKYDIDVDLVAEIIEEYDELMSRELRGRIIIDVN